MTNRERRRRNRGISLSFILAPVLLLATLVGSDPATAITTLTGPVQGIGGKCLDNSGGRLVNGNPIVLWSCNGQSSQQWSLPGDGTIRAGNYCLAVKGAGTTATTPVWLYACDRGPAQLWTIRSNGTVVNPNSGLCLASKNSGTADGNPIWVYTCDAGPAQLWSVPNPSDSSGQSMPIGDLPGWRQVFTDNFATTVPLGQFPAAVSAKWGAYPDGWKDTSKNGTYYPSKVITQSGGLMNLYLHTENGIHMVSAPVPKIQGATGSGGGLLYGRYAVRFRADPVAGYKTAWLLWPDSEQWADGEIDFPEGDLTGHVEAFMHHRGSPLDQDKYPTQAAYGTWHTAITEWTPQAVRFILDGAVIGTSTNPAFIPNTHMHWVLQTETRTAGGPPADTDAGNVQIDWVAAYVPK
ncbi:ricin-type beta-trefoil lectin domain protein [Kribbella monticola]|uniref:ricin-type beta-trefoil lectin domain protein n=1 Tax=Kribbella monticola TaxID=2185285 RepID=UPI000DD2B6DC|nr:ricin-type beta-trefoil lectin domain protein [Kribbella monticola]